MRDLWSLFEFLLPGYLGSRRDFKDRYETPLLNGERGSVWNRLARRLRPYLLRRRKQEILSELPDKIEQVLEVELSPEQKSAYTELQQAARAQIDQLRQQSSGAARMRVLTALLRLRQACCDLRLLGKEGSSSAKLNALLELLQEAIDSGHRALVFSQFTAMLDIIEAALENAGISFCRLDGSTRDRQAVVERFQSDESIPVFLISLKAGGVGLNLPRPIPSFTSILGGIRPSKLKPLTALTESVKGAWSPRSNSSPVTRWKSVSCGCRRKNVNCSRERWMPRRLSSSYRPRTLAS